MQSKTLLCLPYLYCYKCVVSLVLNIQFCTTVVVVVVDSLAFWVQNLVKVEVQIIGAAAWIRIQTVQNVRWREVVPLFPPWAHWLQNRTHSQSLRWYSLYWQISIILAQMHKTFTIQILDSIQLYIYLFHLYILRCSNMVHFIAHIELKCIMVAIEEDNW